MLRLGVYVIWLLFVYYISTVSPHLTLLIGSATVSEITYNETSFMLG